MEFVIAVLVVFAVVAVLLAVFIIIGRIKERPAPDAEAEMPEEEKEAEKNPDLTEEYKEPPAEEAVVTEAAEKRCRVCGERLRTEDSFCQVCGEKV